MPAGATAVPACVLTPEKTEGPYYFNAAQVRRDITEGRSGTPMRLVFTVVRVGNDGCQVLPDAVVDIWHCDATGQYSGYANQNPGGAYTGQEQPTPATGPGGRPPGSPPAGGPGGRPPGPGGGSRATPDVATAEKFLRGIQVTDANGRAEFATIFPGWYQGRLTHIHFKVHVDDKTAVTSQLFMPPAVERDVYANDAPYNTRGQNPTTLAQDNVVNTQAEFDLLAVRATREGSTIVAAFTVGIRV